MDVELLQERDEGFRVGVGLTSSEKWITIATGDHVTSEIWLLPADNPLAEPRLVSARQPGREYDVDEHDGILFIHTNDPSPKIGRASSSERACQYVKKSVVGGS